MNPKAMPLAEYISETMDTLKKSPDAEEILSERGQALRFAKRNGVFDILFKNFNDGWLATQAKG